MLKIKYTDHVTNKNNKKVKEIMDVEKNWSEELAKSWWGEVAVC